MKTTFFLALSSLVPLMAYAEFRSGDLVIAGDTQVSKGGIDLSEQERTVFHEGSVVRGDFGKSILRNAKLINLDLRGVKFGQADIRGSDFSWTDLTGAKFNKAKVEGAHFENAFGISKGDKEALKLRRAFVSDVDPIAKPGALTDSLLNKNSEKAVELIKKDFELEKADDYGHVPLSLAAENGDPDTVRLLLSKKVTVDAVANDGLTPLMIASKEGNSEEVVELLLKAGSNPKLKDAEGNPALWWSIEYGHEGIALLLIDYMHDAVTELEGALTLAEAKDFTKVVEKLKVALTKGAQISGSEAQVQEEKFEPKLEEPRVIEIQELVVESEPSKSENTEQVEKVEQVLEESKEEAKVELPLEEPEIVLEQDAQQEVKHQSDEAKVADEPTIPEMPAKSEPAVEPEKPKNPEQSMDVESSEPAKDDVAKKDKTESTKAKARKPEKNKPEEGKGKGKRDSSRKDRNKKEL